MKRIAPLKRYCSLLPAALVLALAGSIAPCNAQSIGGEDINVIKPYQPSLSDAYKIGKVPDQDTSTYTPPQLNYPITPKKINTIFDPAPIKPVKLKDEGISKLYPYYIKAGFGNYATPYGEIYIGNERAKDLSLTGHYRHLSSKGNIDNSGLPAFSNNHIGLEGSRIFSE